MPIRLLAVDLDGTLLNESKVLSRPVCDAVAAAVSVGVKVVVATARPPRSVCQFYDQLELATPTINYNGAMVFDPASAQPLLHRPMDIDLARQVCDFARAKMPDVLISLEIQDRWLTDRVDAAYHTETSRQFIPDLLAPLSEILDRPVTKLMLLAAHEPLLLLEAEIISKFSSEITVTRSDRDLLQIMTAGTDKGMALEFVAKHLSIPLAECLAIGDAPNDQAMLERAGVGIAMGQSGRQLQKIATHVVADNNHDGVAEAIMKYVLP